MNVSLILAVLVAAAFAEECFPVSGLNITEKFDEIVSLTEDVKKKEEYIEKGMFFSSYDTNGVKYFLSKPSALSVDEAIEICEFFGASLSEIKTANQHTDVKNFLKSVPEDCLYFDDVYISGLYEESKDSFYYHGTTDFEMPGAEIYIKWEDAAIYPKPDLTVRKCIALGHPDYFYRNVKCDSTVESPMSFLCETRGEIPEQPIIPKDGQPVVADASAGEGTGQEEYLDGVKIVIGEQVVALDSEGPETPMIPSDQELIIAESQEAHQPNNLQSVAVSAFVGGEAPVAQESKEPIEEVIITLSGAENGFGSSFASETPEQHAAPYDKQSVLAEVSVSEEQPQGETIGEVDVSIVEPVVKGPSVPNVDGSPVVAEASAVPEDFFNPLGEHTVLLQPNFVEASVLDSNDPLLLGAWAQSSEPQAAPGGQEGEPSVAQAGAPAVKERVAQMVGVASMERVAQAVQEPEEESINTLSNKAAESIVALDIPEQQPVQVAASEEEPQVEILSVLENSAVAQKTVVPVQPASSNEEQLVVAEVASAFYSDSEPATIETEESVAEYVRVASMERVAEAVQEPEEESINTLSNKAAESIVALDIPEQQPVQVVASEEEPHVEILSVLENSAVAQKTVVPVQPVSSNEEQLVVAEASSAFYSDSEPAVAESSAIETQEKVAQMVGVASMERVAQAVQEPEEEYINTLSSGMESIVALEIPEQLTDKQPVQTAASEEEPQIEIVSSLETSVVAQESEVAEQPASSNEGQLVVAEGASAFIVQEEFGSPESPSDKEPVVAESSASEKKPQAEKVKEVDIVFKLPVQEVQEQSSPNDGKSIVPETSNEAEAAIDQANPLIPESVGVPVAESVDQEAQVSAEEVIGTLAKLLDAFNSIKAKESLQDLISVVDEAASTKKEHAASTEEEVSEKKVSEQSESAASKEQPIETDTSLADAAISSIEETVQEVSGEEKSSTETQKPIRNDKITQEEKEVAQALISVIGGVKKESTQELSDALAALSVAANTRQQAIADASETIISY